MGSKIINDGRLDHLDVQLIRTSNQKFAVGGPPSQVVIDPNRENVLDRLRAAKPISLR